MKDNMMCPGVEKGVILKLQKRMTRNQKVNSQGDKYTPFSTTTQQNSSRIACTFQVNLPQETEVFNLEFNFNCCFPPDFPPLPTFENAFPRQSSARGNRPFNHEASSSNQIVPYGKGRIPDERSDLSMIFSLAFGNGSKVDITGNPALIKFLNQIGTRPLDIKAKKKTDMRMGNQLSSTPMSSSFHITEISKGVEKLKQVIKAYPNGLDFNGRSTQSGRELLKGAMDLEQSLRMLVNLQEASEKKSSAQRKIKIRLLDEDEENGDGDSDGRKANIQADQKKEVERPRFSFDKPSDNNSKGNKDLSANNYIKKHLMALTLNDGTPKSDRKIETPISTSANVKAHHKRSVSVPEFRKPMSPETWNHPISPLPRQEKGRISNVIAKLMGLEALPQKENNNHTQKELSLKTKEELVSKTAIIPGETNLSDAERRRPATVDKQLSEKNSKQPGKGFRSALESNIFSPFAAPRGEKIVYNEHEKLHNLQAPAKKYVAAFIGRESPPSNTDRQLMHSISPSVQSSSGYCVNSQGQASAAKGKQDKEKIRENKNQVHHNNTSKIADNCESQGAKTIGKASETGVRSKSRIQPGKQKNPYSDREMQHLKRTKEIERQEDKSQVQKRKQHLGRQKVLTGGRKIDPMESAISSERKIKYRSPLPNLGQEAQKESKFLRPIGSLTPVKHLSHNTDHEKNVQQEILSKATYAVVPAKDLSRHRDHENTVQQETPSKLSVIQRTTEDGNTCRGGTKDKFDSVVNRKGKENVALPNDQSLVLHEITQENRNKIYEEGTELHKHHQHIEAEVADEHPKKSIDQPLNVKVTTHIEAIDSTKLCSFEEEGQLQEISQKLPLNEKVLSIEAGLAFNDNCHDGQPAVSEYIELKQEKPSTYQQTETCFEEKNCNKIQVGVEEQLTESEELLKQKLTKSTYFLNTAEALLKLNIPVRVLIGDDDKVQDTETKLALDCSYELLNWKGKKHELSAHPYSCLSNSDMNRAHSFRELIKQLCKDFDALKLYGGSVDSESDVADVLHTMLEKDIQHGHSDVSFMWDHGWGELTFPFLEKDDITKEMEKHVLNGLLNEITIDLLDSATTI